MAEFSGPWSNVGLPDNRYQRLFSDSQPQLGGGVMGDAATQPVVTVNAGATAVDIGPIEVQARGRYYRNDATVTLTPAAPGAQRRIDRAVVRFDPANKSATLRLLQGTEVSSSVTIPAPPALTDTFDGVFDVPIARFEVNPLAPTVRSLVMETAYLGLPTLVVPHGLRPGERDIANPHMGQPIWDDQISTPLWWNGKGWVDPRRASLVSEAANLTEMFAPETGEWVNGLRFDRVMPPFGRILRLTVTCDSAIGFVQSDSTPWGPQFRWSMNNSQFGPIRQIFPAGQSSLALRWSTGTFTEFVSAPPYNKLFTLGFQFRNNTGQDVGMRVRNLVGIAEAMG